MLAPDSGSMFRGRPLIVPPLPGRSVDTCLRSPGVSPAASAIQANYRRFRVR
jgi:hypothetical protein